jgi:hypothetical protein
MLLAVISGLQGDRRSSSVGCVCRCSIRRASRCTHLLATHASNMSTRASGCTAVHVASYPHAQVVCQDYLLQKIANTQQTGTPNCAALTRWEQAQTGAHVDGDDLNLGTLQIRTARACSTPRGWEPYRSRCKRGSRLEELHGTPSSAAQSPWRCAAAQGSSCGTGDTACRCAKIGGWPARRGISILHAFIRSQHGARAAGMRSGCKRQLLRVIICG